MAAILFPTCCSAPLENLRSQPPNSLSQQQGQVPLFLHILQKTERAGHTRQNFQHRSSPEDSGEAKIRDKALTTAVQQQLYVHGTAEDNTHTTLGNRTSNLEKGKPYLPQEVSIDGVSNSFTMKEVTDFDPFTMKEVTDDYGFDVFPMTEETHDDGFGAFTIKEVTADDDSSNASTMKEVTDDTNDDGFNTFTMQDITDDGFDASTTRKATMVTRDASFSLSTVKGVTYDARFDTFTAKEIPHSAIFTMKAGVTLEDKVDALTTKGCPAVSPLMDIPPMSGQPGFADVVQAEDSDMTFNEKKILVFETENNETLSQGQETRLRTHRVSRSWEDLWQFQEESEANCTAPFVSEAEYSETISMVLNVAKGLPKNVTLQEQLGSFSGRINSVCGNAILYRLQKERLFLPALSCFEWMRLHTPCLLDSRSLCTIFTILGDANMVDRALVLFNNMKDHKKLWFVHVFNALLSALSKHDRYDEALMVFQEMSKLCIEPDSITFCILINLAQKSGSGVKVVWQIFCDMEEKKVFASHEVFGALMKAFCEKGMREEALKLMSVMEGRGLIPNVVIYNTLIDAYAKACMLEEAEGLVSEMKGKGIRMSVVTYNSLIGAYGSQQNFTAAEARLQEMLDKGPKPNVRSYTALITAYGRHRLSEKAASVFLRMKKNGVSPNTISYSALIHAYAESGWHKKAEYAFENMLREGLVPSVETYTSLLHGFRQAGDLEKVKSVWKRMQLEKCKGTRATFNVMMDAYARQGCYAEARDVIFEFNRIGHKPDRKTYNMLINAYARGGQHSKVPQILEEMRDAGFAPDSFTYTTLIFTFLRVRDFSKAFKYHEKMCRDNQLPDKLTYMKLKAILDAKHKLKVEKNMKAGIGFQRKQHTSVQGSKKAKFFWKRRKPSSNPRFGKGSKT